VKLIVGLGNPGPQYERTRHNAGFMTLDRLAARHAPGAVSRSRFQGLAIEARLSPNTKASGWAKPAPSPEPATVEEDIRLLLLKPMTYMNRSGFSVVEAVHYYRIEPHRDLLIVVDEVALDVGDIRLRPKGSPGGHNGLADIERALATDNYPRLRIGIGPRGVIPQVDYVLGRFTEEQLQPLDDALERSADACEVWAREGIDAAMNRFNTKPRPDPDTSSQDSAPTGDSDQNQTLNQSTSNQPTPAPRRTVEGN